MAISREEAAAALLDIESTERRGLTLRGYWIAGPILMLWALIWATGYTAMGFLPMHQWGSIWLPLDAVGVIGSLLIWRKIRHGAGQQAAGVGWRMMAGTAAGAAFIAATFAVLQPSDPAAYLAFPGLLIGLIYTVIGLLGALRYLLVGAVMFGMTLIGFFVFQPWLPFWMAAASVALFISGVWMWRR
jgi:hypothetical protein